MSLYGSGLALQTIHYQDSPLNAYLDFTLTPADPPTWPQYAYALVIRCSLDGLFTGDTVLGPYAHTVDGKTGEPGWLDYYTDFLVPGPRVDGPTYWRLETWFVGEPRHIEDPIMVDLEYPDETHVGASNLQAKCQ